VDYVTLKVIHVSAVTLSFCGFFVRGVGTLRGAAWVKQRATRTVADLVDTVLLLSAIGMLVVIHVGPWELAWLRAKIVGLVVYIALGIVALRPTRAGREPRAMRVRFLCWVGALLVFGYIVSVAVTKSPCGAVMWLRRYPGTLREPETVYRVGVVPEDFVQVLW
jgi:uncharacterized membrane protein SirB2